MALLYLAVIPLGALSLQEHFAGRKLVEIACEATGLEYCSPYGGAQIGRKHCSACQKLYIPGLVYLWCRLRLAYALISARGPIYRWLCNMLQT